MQKAVATSSFKQPLRPRVVELSRNRKSTVGVVESVDDAGVPDVPSREGSKAESEIRGELNAGGEKGDGGLKQDVPSVPTIEVSSAEGEVVNDA